MEAVQAGRSVYFITLAVLVGSLAKAEREGTLRERIRFLCRLQLLVVDGIGCLPVASGGRNLFFQLVNARYERGAMILTSNRGFAEWGELFGDTVVATALLDRLLHHAIVVRIEGAATASAATPTCCPKHHHPIRTDLVRRSSHAAAGRRSSGSTTSIPTRRSPRTEEFSSSTFDGRASASRLHCRSSRVTWWTTSCLL